MRGTASASDPRNQTLAKLRRGAAAAALVALTSTASPAAPRVAAGGLTAVGEHNLEIARTILERRRDAPSSDFYAACMSAATRAGDGIEALAPLRERIAAIDGPATLADALARLDNAGVDALWHAGVEVVSYGAPHVGAVLSPPGSTEGEYHPIPVAMLADIVPEVDWVRYFRDRGFPPLETIDVRNVDYFAAVATRLRQTPPDALKNELRERMTAAFSPWIGRHDDDRFPRWKRCVALVDTEMGGALEHEFVRETISPQRKQRAEQLVAAVVASMREDLGHVPWLGSLARREAIDKLDAMTFAIAYPERWPPVPRLTIARDDLIADIVHAREGRISVEVSRAGMPVDRKAFDISLLSVNAYYAPMRNELVVPAGILQSPLFGEDAAVNYGTIGAVVGHELTHAFDEHGRRYDASGRRRDWWTPQDARAFDTRADCIARQFSSYGANGPLVRDEAVADLGGLELSYRAFAGSGSFRSGEEERRFFDAFAHLFGNAGADVANDVHPPAALRAEVALENVPEYFIAFGRVAPKERCSVW